MTKVVLNDISSGFASTDALNTNFQRIEEAFDNTLSLDGSVPNSMNADLDMNSKAILNLPAPATPNSPLRLADIPTTPQLSASAINTTISDSGNYFTSSNVEGALQEAASFQQTGTGTVLRPVEEKLWDIPTPKDYGVSESTSLGIGTNILRALTTGTKDTGFGFQVLQNTTTGTENTGVGYAVLSSLTGGADPLSNYNTAIGSFALALCTTGYKNTAGGRACMDNLTTGYQSAAWGYGSMHFATTTVNCSALGFESLHGGASGPVTAQGAVALGFRALYGGLTCDFTTAVGTSALASCTSGVRNTAIGTNALNALTTTSDNSALGYAAGITHTGSGSIFVGQNADANAGLDNVTVIGTGLTAIASNTCILGNSQTVVPGVANYDIGSQSLPTWGYGIFNKAVYAWQGTAIPAGGANGTGFLLSSTANFGIFFGSNAPTLSAAKGSLYLRSDATTNTSRAYINTDGGTTWTAINTVA